MRVYIILVLILILPSSVVWGQLSSPEKGEEHLEERSDLPQEKKLSESAQEELAQPEVVLTKAPELLKFIEAVYPENAKDEHRKTL